MKNEIGQTTITKELDNLVGKAYEIHERVKSLDHGPQRAHQQAVAGRLLNSLILALNDAQAMEECGPKGIVKILLVVAILVVSGIEMWA